MDCRRADAFRGPELKRSLDDLSAKQVEQLLALQCAVAENCSSTRKGPELRQKATDDLARLCAGLGLTGRDAGELPVVLEHNRRHLWRSLLAHNCRITTATQAPTRA